LLPFLRDPAEVNVRAAGLFACVGLLFPATVALLNFESNRLMGPNVAGAVGGLSPVFAVLSALLLLGEQLRTLQLVGIAAIIAGVVLIYRGQWQAFASTVPWLLALPLGTSAIRLELWHNPIAAVVIGYAVSSMLLILDALLPRSENDSIITEHLGSRPSAWSMALPFCRCMPRLAADL
jgi:drug/metabolite transporter (DMT)-like permease